MKLVVAFMLAVLATGAAADNRAPVPTSKLTAHSWTPDGRTRAHVVGLHSFGDYHAAFAHLGPWFARHGIAVHAYDQRGFGRTANNGHWAGTDRMVADAVHVARRVQAEGAEHIYLMGESMGGAVAMLAAVRAPELIDGLILAAPAVREGIWIRYIYNAGLSVVATLAAGATHEVERNADNPDLRPGSAQRLARDPLVVSQVRMDTYQGLIALADRASNRAPEIWVPVLLLFGGWDESIPEVSIQRLREHLGEQVSFYRWEDEAHLLLQSRHWHDHARTITDWLNSRIPGPRQHAAAR